MVVGGLRPDRQSVHQVHGSFDRQGGTISGLLINRPTTNYVGLFGYVGIGGDHVGLQNVTVTGQNDTGALAGYNSGAITLAYAAGTVSGAGLVGGLVGVNVGTITQAYATAAVSGTGNYVGGLAGYNSNAITQSYAAGTVSGLSYVGGLAGDNPGTITQSYWDVTTSGNAAVSDRKTQPASPELPPARCRIRSTTPPPTRAAPT